MTKSHCWRSLISAITREVSARNASASPAIILGVNARDTMLRNIWCSGGSIPMMIMRVWARLSGEDVRRSGPPT